MGSWQNYILQYPITSTTDKAENYDYIAGQIQLNRRDEEQRSQGDQF